MIALSLAYLLLGRPPRAGRRLDARLCWIQQRQQQFPWKGQPRSAGISPCGSPIRGVRDRGRNHHRGSHTYMAYLLLRGTYYVGRYSSIVHRIWYALVFDSHAYEPIFTSRLQLKVLYGLACMYWSLGRDVLASVHRRLYSPAPLNAFLSTDLFRAYTHSYIHNTAIT